MDNKAIMVKYIKNSESEFSIAADAFKTAGASIKTLNFLAVTKRAVCDILLAIAAFAGARIDDGYKGAEIADALPHEVKGVMINFALEYYDKYLRYVEVYENYIGRKMSDVCIRPCADIYRFCHRWLKEKVEDEPRSFMIISPDSFFNMDELYEKVLERERNEYNFRLMKYKAGERTPQEEEQFQKLNEYFNDLGETPCVVNVDELSRSFLETLIADHRGLSEEEENDPY